MFVHHSCNNQARNRHRTYSTLPAVTKEAVCNWRENDGKDLHAETNKPRIRNALRIDPTLTLAVRCTTHSEHRRDADERRVLHEPTASHGHCHCHGYQMLLLQIVARRTANPCGTPMMASVVPATTSVLSCLPYWYCGSQIRHAGTNCLANDCAH